MRWTFSPQTARENYVERHAGAGRVRKFVYACVCADRWRCRRCERNPLVRAGVHNYVEGLSRR